MADSPESVSSTILKNFTKRQVANWNEYPNEVLYVTCLTFVCFLAEFGQSVQRLRDELSETEKLVGTTEYSGVAVSRVAIALRRHPGQHPVWSRFTDRTVSTAWRRSLRSRGRAESSTTYQAPVHLCPQSRILCFDRPAGVADKSAVYKRFGLSRLYKISDPDIHKC